MNKGKKFINVPNKKIVVLKETKYAYVGYNAHGKPPFSPAACRIFNEYTGYVINNNGEEKNENIDRNEIHVEDTTGYK